MSDNGMKSGSNLEKVLKAGHFAFTGECGPPKGANVEHLKEKFEHLRGVVDAVNVTDNQTAVVRMSSKAASALMVHSGTPVIPAAHSGVLGIPSSLPSTYSSKLSKP